ncbi:putative E3 ubiquitin-protein ligase RF298 [Cocos nucifera]|uniref:Putative E3 ubiquitin-protein ligase RF298 n=1 Tax=Cocos nucifera TaxID=13894 RepID=A0A8K0HWC9_COCNU|nr:putative E3 ubiquitin-protein ligase RF298 [Cocos nucifera]
MATPSGNSPSFRAPIQGSGRDNKRKLEDYPLTFEQYVRLKFGFLNSHARICDTCKSLLYGSREEPQFDYAYDSNSISLTETQLGDMVLGHMDVIYKKVIEELSSNYGYPEDDATTAVLATGICYGCKDPIGNALKHALTFLKCGLRVDKPKRENFSAELKTLVNFVSMTVYDEWSKRYPYLGMDDFLLWLLIYRNDPSDISKLAGYPFGALENLKVSSCSTCLQRKEDSTSNSSTIQFMPMAGVTEEDDNLDASSPHSENAYKPELTAATGIPPGLACGRFIARTSLSVPNSNPNAAIMSSSDSLIGKFSSLTISDSSNPEEKSVCANSKDADNSRRGFTHRRPERRRRAGLIGTARKVVNRALESTKSTALDSNCTFPSPDIKVGLESSQSFVSENFSFGAGSFASSSFSVNIVNTTTSLPHATNVDAFTSMQSKSNSYASFIPDDVVGSIPYVPEKLLSRVKDLQLQLEYWTKWAHHTVLQVTNKLNRDKAELQSLRQEKLEARKEEEAFAKSTMTKIEEMDKALERARTEVQVASDAMCKLEFEKIRVEEELEAAKVRASKSAANYQEASRKEIMALKKSQTCERERALSQEELVSEKRVLSRLQKQLQQAQMSHGQVEARWKQEERLKSEELTKALNVGKEHEQLEASAKSEEDMIRLKNERNMQSCIDDIRKLRRQTAELKLMVDSSNFARLDWAQSAYFTTDKMGFKESGIREVQRDWECVMCLAEEISVVFLPCAHLILCTKCNELHKKEGLGDCPSCRTTIKQRICIRLAYNI